MTAPRWLPFGVGGLKRAGKDSLFRAVAAELRRRRGSDFAATSVAFADALRATTTAAYGLPSGDMAADYERVKDEVDPRWGITRRQMMINLGVPATLPGGSFDHWAIRWGIEVEAEVADLFVAADDFVSPPSEVEAMRAGIFVGAPDVRRLNEAATIIDRGGFNVLVCSKRASWNGHVTEALAYLAELAAADPGMPPLVFGDARIDAFVKYERPDCASLLEGTWRQHAGRPIFDVVIRNDGAEADLAAQAVGVADELMRRMP